MSKKDFTCALIMLKQKKMRYVSKWFNCKYVVLFFWCVKFCTSKQAATKDAITRETDLLMVYYPRVSCLTSNGQLKCTPALYRVVQQTGHLYTVQNTTIVASILRRCAK